MSLPANVERTGWRDAELSRRHRQWGFDCPATDIDLLMVEFSLGLPAGLVEFKHEAAAPVHLEHPSYRAVAELADRSSVPFIVARYWPDVWCFEVTPANNEAASITGRRAMSEREFVGLLHDLRGLVVQERVLRHLREEVLCVAASRP